MRPRQAIALLALVGAFVAVYLTLFKLGYVGQLTCSVGDCETVNTSRYAILLGVPVAAWGLGGYLAIFAVAAAGLRDALADSRPLSLALVGLSGAGLLFSAWLTYLELYVIHAICVWCVTSATIVTLIFLASLIDLRAVTPAAEERAGD